MSNRKIEKKIKKLMDSDQDAVIQAVLENMSWPQDVLTNYEYFVREDDSDGVRRGIKVRFLSNGDGIINFEECAISSDPGETSHPHDHSYRFRTTAGGGHSVLVQSALLILVKAVITEHDEYFDHSMLV